MAKAKKCKACGISYITTRPLQKACSLPCAVILGKQKTAQDEKKQDRIKRESLKSRAHWLKEAQTAVNAYVRVRDKLLGCVSCDRPASWPGQWHASHFRSVGAASAVRFNLWNIHKSCSICNNWKSGNLIDYEHRLKEKIGPARVDWIKTQNHCAKYSIEYLQRIKRIFAKRTKLKIERLKNAM